MGLKSPKELEERFSRVLAPYLLDPLGADSFDRPLRDLGVDSVQLVALVAALEEGLGIRFEDEEISRENFRTPRSLFQLVAKKIPA